MPMIDFTLPAGTMNRETRDELLEELADTLLRWEGAPDTDFFRSITWAYAREIDPDALYVGGRPGGDSRFRVEITVPEGALSDRRKAGLVGDVTKAVLSAAELGDDAGLRVWTVIHEVPDGNWGAAGQIIRFQQLREAAAAQREAASTEAPEPAPA